jgi:hypothetical protein
VREYTLFSSAMPAFQTALGDGAAPISNMLAKATERTARRIKFPGEERNRE